VAVKGDGERVTTWSTQVFGEVLFWVSYVRGRWASKAHTNREKTSSLISKGSSDWLFQQLNA